MRKAIATGNASTNAQAIAWLRAHGAEIESCHAITLIILPEHALLENRAGWLYTIEFYDPDGNREDQYVEIELNVDAYETVLTLKQE